MEPTLSGFDEATIDKLILQRSVLRKRKSFEEADHISQSLRSHDIVISDNADGSTTWTTKVIPDNIPKEDKLPRTSARYRKMVNKNLRRKAVKSRGREFAKWVLCHFNDFFSNECTTILDIAGGKGEVSYYIASHFLRPDSSVPSGSRPRCVIIDPMPVALSRQKTKDLIRRHVHRYTDRKQCQHQVLSSDCPVTASVTEIDTEEEAKAKQHLTFAEWHRENESVVSRMPSYAGHFQPLEHFQLAMHLSADKRILWLDRLTMLDEAEREFGSSSGNEGGGDGDCDFNDISVPTHVCQAAQSALCSLDELNIGHIQDYFNTNLLSSKLSHLLSNAITSSGRCDDIDKGPSTLLLGFHPDEPTADIVDTALSHSIPFVVVPCCVFPTKFSSRFLKSGAAVRSFEDFILFLKEKDSRIRECVLDALLKPNNIALYMLPADCANGNK